MKTVSLALRQAPGGPLDRLRRALFPLDHEDRLESWHAQECVASIGLPPDLDLTAAELTAAIPEILECLTSYDDALEEGALKVGNDVRLALNSGLTEERLERFLEEHAKKQRPPLTLTFTIDKTALILGWLDAQGSVPADGTRIFLYFYRENLEKIFRRPTHQLETQEREGEGLWPRGPAQKIVLLAPVWGGFLEGPYLAVVGGDPVAGWNRLSPRGKGAKHRFTIGLEELAEARNDSLGWENRWLKFLTPLHLLVHGDTRVADPVAQTLLRHRANLCILFSADRTFRAGEGLEGLRAVYSGGQQKAEVGLAPLPDVPPGSELSKAEVESLEGLVGWAYTDKLTADRLSFLQVAISGALRGLPESSVSFLDLLARAERIREDLDIRWDVFIEGKIDAFTAEVRALEDDVASTAQAFSEQTSAVIRNLSETMLAAVAVVLGSFVASVFSKDSDPEILRIGLLLYLVYLLVFPLSFNMVERQRSFRALLKHFAERRQRFAQAISPKKVSSIVDLPLQRSVLHFHFWFGLTLATYLIVAVVLWLVIPPPYRSIPFEPPDAPALTGPLAPNQDLRGATVFAQWQVDGPEDVATDHAGRLYTGTRDGRIARVTFVPGGSPDVLTFARTGGRPLGLRFDPAGNLIVAVAQKGLLSIDPAGKVTVLVAKAGGVPLGFVNALSIARDGKIYFSESAPGYSSTSHLDELLRSRPRGRLLAYNPKAQGDKVSVLLENLFFANGVALTTDQRAVLVAETYAYRIRRYWLEGPKKGKSDLFAANLPGFPDNLMNDQHGRYWLALVTVRKPILDWIHPYPFLKEQLVKLPRTLWPRPASYGLVAVLDENGRIVRSLHDPGGRTVRGISTARPWRNHLYLGTFDGEWLAVAPLPASP